MKIKTQVKAGRLVQIGDKVIDGSARAKLRLFRARKAFAEIYGSVDALDAPREWEAR